MSLEQASKPIWPAGPYDGPEESAAVNLTKCEHGWSRDSCGVCSPLPLPLIKRMKKTGNHYHPPVN